MKRILLALLLAAPAIALAAGSGLNQFTPPPGDTSVDFLHEVFGKIVNMVASGADVRTQEADDVLGQMMAVFNTAVLFLGMVFVAYTTILGTVNSAHDGEILGKKMSEVWVPIRTVGGTALVLPLASGYSTLQIGVLWLTLQGVGVADAIWNTALGQISKDNMIARPILPDARPLAANILRFEVCAAAMNKQYRDSGWPYEIQPVREPRTMTNKGDWFNVDFMTKSAAGAIQTVTNSSYTVVDYKWRILEKSSGKPAQLNPDVCGGITWKESWESSESNANTKVIKAPIMAAHAKAVDAMIQELRPAAQAIVNGSTYPPPGLIEVAAEHYTDKLKEAAKTAVLNTNDKARADFLKAAEVGGWIFAGTWYNHIVKMNDVMQSTLNGLPTSDPISITDYNTQETLQNYRDFMAVANEYTIDRTGAVKGVYTKETAFRAPSEGEEPWDYIKKMLSAPFMGAINQMTQEIAGSNLNHMSQVKSFGETIIASAEVALALMTKIAGVSNSWAAQLSAKIAFDASAAVSFLGPMITILILMLLGFGFTCAVYIPLIPFILWVTSVANWFVLVIEAVLAAPIWAVAHIHPDGDDAVGRGGQGYMMILSLMMRPALMLFGLVTAMLLSQPIASLVNASFMTAISGIETSSMTGLVKFIGYVGIYAVIMTIVLHTVFSLIHWIPDNVPRWIGAHVSGGPASPDQKEKEVGHIIAGGISRTTSGAGHRPKKPEKEGGGEPESQASKDAKNKELLGG
jgi:conjugal transfer/type IV secretion protein DotA/TraY